MHKHEVVMSAGSIIVVCPPLAAVLDLVGLLLVGAEDEEEDREQHEAVVEAEYHS